MRQTKEDILKGLEGLRERLCCYMGPRCDCKYLTPNCDIRPGTEQTGCCEIRAAIEYIEDKPKVDAGVWGATFPGCTMPGLSDQHLDGSNNNDETT